MTSKDKAINDQWKRCKMIIELIDEDYKNVGGYVLASEARLLRRELLKLAKMAENWWAFDD